MTEEPHPLSSFGAWLRHERIAANIYISKLAADVGISREMVRLLENGQRSPSAATTIALAGEFNQNAWEILAHFDIIPTEALRALANVRPPDYIPKPFEGFTRPE